MTGSMYASIAGLKAHMQKLTVIGNNVANVNTTAYKKQRTVFRDSVYSMYTSGSNGSQTVGGMNPSQLGYGSLVANIDLDMSTSSYNPGNPMDCAIVGDGFFMVGNKDQQDTIDPTDPQSFKTLKLTRVGDFEFKADGYLSDGQGNVVYGFQCVGTDANGKPQISDQLVPLRLPQMERAILNKDTGAEAQKENGQYPTTIYDPATNKLADGYEWGYAVRYPVNKTTGGGTGGGTGGTPADPNAVTYKKLEDYDAANNYDEDELLKFAELESISIDKKTGCISGITREGAHPVTIGYLALGVVTNPNGVSHTGQSYYQCGDGAGDLRVTMMGGIEKQLGFKYVNGELQSATTADGTQNPDATTVELPDGAEITSAGDVSLLTGFLEAPNVDLATEISELITTQRGYQANTRIITVTDSMLEELVNMKR